MPKPTTGPYRTTAPADEPVFCKDCVHHERRTSRLVNQKSLTVLSFCARGDETHRHPVTGERVYDKEAQCVDRNASLACTDFTPLPPSWWQRMFPARRYRRKV